MRSLQRYVPHLVTLVAILVPMLVMADVNLSGTVEGKQGDDVVDAGVVDIKVYRQGAIVAADSTSQGQYSIKVQGAAPIDRITFESQNNDWHPWVIRAISASRVDARLPVLLMPDNGPLRYDLYLDQLLAYEQLFYLAFNAPRHFERQENEARIKKAYRTPLLTMPSAGELNGITPEQLIIATKKRNDVLQLYGIRTAPDLRHSAWDTTYIINGNTVNTVATINGVSGTNDLVQNGRRLPFGVLNNIKITRDGAKVTISGTWKVRKSTKSGYFRWKIDPQTPDAFFGEWGIDPDVGRLGSWTGVLR